ncbi:MAG TPA: class I SAM-dependent methyltransferase [Arenibacter sp.]|nr:class I SAM-dependent methyltransferase [Arenibacter sp.]
MLDSGFRHLFQNPKKIVSKFMDPGMAVLDLGCGTGYFTTEIAKHLNPSGKVVAVDVQQGMLDILIKKIEKQDYGKRIEIHHCQEQHLGLKQRFDFILAFYSFHEMEYLDGIIRELQEISNPGTRILIVEQKFHVSKLMFLSFIKKMESNNFTVIEKPNIFLSRAVLMERK